MTPTVILIYVDELNLIGTALDGKLICALFHREVCFSMIFYIVPETLMVW